MGHFGLSQARVIGFADVGMKDGVFQSPPVRSSTPYYAHSTCTCTLLLPALTLSFGTGRDVYDIWGCREFWKWVDKWTWGALPPVAPEKSHPRASCSLLGPAVHYSGHRRTFRTDEAARALSPQWGGFKCDL